MLDRPTDAPQMDELARLRETIRDHLHAPEDALVRRLTAEAELSQADRAAIENEAARLVTVLRETSRPGLMEVFLTEYGLSTEEGLALMCLAEALLRVPDGPTVDALIADKVGPGRWIEHFGKSGSALVNASTLGLALTGRVLKTDEAGGLLRSAARRLGEPIIRQAVTRAMREMGQQFVLGQTIKEAAERARKLEEHGYTHSYDMLGEAAMTAADARGFRDAYDTAIRELAKAAHSSSPRDNPGISIKLSALHPRYEAAQRERVLAELVPVVLDLAQTARNARMSLNIDAEEAARLDLSLDVIEAVLSDPSLAGWDGFGVVVQAYGKRASHTIDWLHALAERLDRRIMVRLVKGAYWDTEIKLAQVEGVAGFPVFTRKSATDVSFIACARKLLGITDRIYPQFATHNAHTIAAVMHMAKGETGAFEFQRLHGMGDALHDHIVRETGARCRIYAPVGRHRELLAYLVRRLLENGANSSFVNQVVDEDVPPREVVADPFAAASKPRRDVTDPAMLFAPRLNSQGFDLSDPVTLEAIDAARNRFADHVWSAEPLLAHEADGADAPPVRNPARPDEIVGRVRHATEADARRAVAAAKPWSVPAAERAETLRRAAMLYEEHYGEVFALLAREAGKGLPDAVAELREAVDFLRYYAAEAERLGDRRAPLGTVTAISPWNFPLAIYTGQIAAALAAGNAVVAKPAEETPLIGALGARLMHEAGVPRTALQFLPGPGESVGAALTSTPGVDGVCFTGSTETAQTIHRAMADHLSPHAPLIAETGGLNAMIVDSTALPEQAVRDIVMSAFRSAGQRCSALRVLYVQEDVASDLLTMLTGAMDELRVGDPWHLKTDIGPVINAEAKAAFRDYAARAEREGRLIHRIAAPDGGHLFGPVAIRVGGIAEVEREVFGPVLHVATFPSGATDGVVDAINARGYGLTFGLHTRLTDRASRLTRRIRAGNAYVNRNQIGAIVGSQPFGGEGLSGTGPKAGGPHYVPRFLCPERPEHEAVPGKTIDAARVQAWLDAAVTPHERLTHDVLPGPTGEANELSTYPRGPVLCLGPTAEDALDQAEAAASRHCPAIRIAPGASGENAVDGTLDPAALETLRGIAVVAHWGDEAMLRPLRQALSKRDGPIVPLGTSRDLASLCVLERHVCTDTTAAGGNAALIGGG